MNTIVKQALRIGLTPANALQGLADWRDNRRYPPPGQIVKVDGRDVHLVTSGMDQPGPTVVFESSEAGYSLDWQLVQPEVAAFAPVVAYDRPGFGWSDPPDRPMSGLQLVANLREALRVADIKPPYVLVGHSFGGMLVRLFAAHHTAHVAGYVVLDGLHRNDMNLEIDLNAPGERLSDEDKHSLDVLHMAGKAGMLRLLFERGLPVYKRKVPDDLYKMYRARFVSSNAVEALISQLHALPETLAQVSSQLSEPPEDLPSVTVRTEAGLQDPLDNQTEMEQTIFFGRMQTIQWDRPHAVARAVRDVIGKIESQTQAAE